MAIRIKLCFLIDCTGSMEGWIQAAKDQTKTISKQVRDEHATAEILLAFCGYRDYGDDEQYINIPFQNIDDVLDNIQNVHANGGDDCAEDVAGGLSNVHTLDWADADVRVLVHIADAPPHGSLFHAPSDSDRYPGGDPNGLNPLDIMKSLADKNIDYTFIKINNSTNRMLKLFHSVYEEKSFKVVDLRPQASDILTPPRIHRETRHDLLSPAVTRSITQSIGRYTSSQDPAEV